MSAYAVFYIRHQDVFIPFANYSRSHPVYDAFFELPYEKIVCLSSGEIEQARSRLQEELDRTKTYIQKCHDRIAVIQNMEGSIQEKLEAIFGEQSSITEAENEIQAYEEGLHFCAFLDEVEDNWTMYCDSFKEDHPNEELNEYALYGGVECWMPTVKDVVGNE